MTRQVSPLALLVLALMALALAVLWLAPGVPAGWRHWQAPAPQAPKLDDVQAAARQFNPAAVAVYPAVLERPLMSPARRPPAPASAAVAAPAARRKRQPGRRRTPCSKAIRWAISPPSS